ncbi:MAG: ribose-phosphate diphosphokinase [Rhodocyclaceae bacterium]|jgi:ribose-phosphate pyrophosphokinase|nr:ribose-phosphate diphosphokinase [Rhodocyclaceae bacterium]MCL4758246.1 ribose-phosphate diphosphokinase [Rhodocyclaceae bacterium]
MGVPELLLHFDDEAVLAGRIAEAAACPAQRIECHRFPDGELRLRLPEHLPPSVAVLRSLDHPNEKLVELLLAARCARALGARSLTLLAPYLAYMRQDIAFVPGEAVSQRIVGAFLAELFDAVITVDPHLHRVSRLSDAVPARAAIALSGAPLLAGLVAQRRDDPFLIGPDEESLQWVAGAAATYGFDHEVCRKIRHGDRDVEIALPDVPVAGRRVVILDDVASSGHTVAVAARLLLAAGATSVDLAVTHALFASDASERVREAGVGEVWSTDTIAHPSNAVSVAPALAAALTGLSSALR